jgi:abhydrolase domain-containing protein 6
MKKLFFATTTFVIVAFLIVYFFMPGTIFGLVQILERKASGLQEKTIVVNNLNIHYLEGGKGEPLILIHGFGANKDNWTRISKFLTPHFRVIAPDLPGFGESSKEPGNKYTIKDQSYFIKKFAEKIKISSFHIGGSSMGGNIAGYYAFLFPGNLKSLFLIAPGGVFSSEPSEMQQMQEPRKNMINY